MHRLIRPSKHIGESVRQGGRSVNERKYWRCGVLALAITALAAGGTAVAAKPTVAVATGPALQQAVDDPQNAGKVIVLAPGTYTLDPSLGSTKGRLELQTDMELQGVVGDTAKVTIDASQLPAASYQDGGPTGALRMGKGTNAVRWLTLTSANGGTAFIETDLAPTAPDSETSVTVEHCVIQSSRRGIDFRLAGTAANGRTLEGFFRHNVLRANASAMGQGLRIVIQGAERVTLRATVEGNFLEGNLAGMFAAANDSTRSAIHIASTANSYSGNGVGCLLVGGLAISQRADDNRLSFDSIADAFAGNAKPTAAYAQTGIGLAATGGDNGAATGGLANGNRVDVTLVDSRLTGNPVVDLAAIGAHGTAGNVAGQRNRVFVRLAGDTTAGVIQQVDSDPAEPTNHATIVQHP